MTRTLICLARHGETNWNLERRFQGQLDIPLNVKGRAQAAALTAELAGARFDRIYSSDLRRAVATASGPAVERGLPIEKVPALREKNDGVWQCLTHPQVEALYPEDYRRYRSRRADFAIPGGETLERFAARSRAILTKIAKAHPGETVLIVSHAGVLDIAYRLATGKKLDESREQPVLNAAPNWVAYEDGAWSLVNWASEENCAPVLAPYDGLELPLREAARLLIVNPRGEVLLFRYSSRMAPILEEAGFPHFWAAPGGALEPGESIEAAARRELREETGLSGVDLGPVHMTRSFPMQIDGAWVQALEHYFLLRVDAFDPRPQALTDAEKAHLSGWKWWSAEQVEKSTEAIFPEGLYAELRRLE